MDAIAISDELYAALDRHCVRVAKPRSAVLFTRGDQPFGIFLVLTGSVMLDFGNGVRYPCGPGALIGLPATLPKTVYSMTATVVRDASLGFLSTKRLFDLLEKQPQLSLWTC